MGNITKAERERRAAEKAEAAKATPDMTPVITPVITPDMTPDDALGAANKVEQGNAAAPPEADPPPVTFAEPAAPDVSLDDYIRRQVALKVKRNIMLVSVTYPGAEKRVYDATYCGVQVSSGQLGCVWSDGTTDGGA